MPSFLKSLLFFFLLTLLSQVGGILYLLHKPLSRSIKRRLGHGWRGSLVRATSFVLVLSFASITVVPLLARPFSRVPLPLSANSEVPIAPARWFTVLANQHYVSPELRAAVIEIARQTARTYPGTELRYLDANFPFLTGFPLLLRRLNWRSADVTFDESANRWLLEAITADDRIGKVFVEPHLKRRIGQSGNDKIRFHGCAAVRHDDHIHVQL